MMTELELRAAVSDFCLSVGPKAEVSLNINDRNSGWTKPVYFALYRDGVVGGVTFSFEAETFEEALRLGREKWEAQRIKHEARVVRQIALAIIRITAEQGECTDAALRQEFDSEDIARFGKLAIEDANAIAANGPFAIVHMQGANAA